MNTTLLVEETIRRLARSFWPAALRPTLVPAPAHAPRLMVAMQRDRPGNLRLLRRMG